MPFSSPGVGAEGHGLRERGNGPCAVRQHEHVVVQRGPVDERDGVQLGVDPRDGTAEEPARMLGHQLRKRQIVDVTSAERHGNAKRAHDEIGFRGDQRDAQQPLCQLVERENGLERGDASADDDDAQWCDVRGFGHRSIIAADTRPAIGVTCPLASVGDTETAAVP